MIIRTYSDLSMLQTGIHREIIRAEFPILSEQENKRLTNQINRYIHPCGCKAAAAALIGAILFFSVDAIGGHYSVFLFGPISWAMKVFFILGFTMLAKFIGKRAEQKKWMALLQKLENIATAS